VGNENAAGTGGKLHNSAHARGLSVAFILARLTLAVSTLFSRQNVPLSVSGIYMKFRINKKRSKKSVIMANFRQQIINKIPFF
jgi:hypothetical protein